MAFEPYKPRNIAFVALATRGEWAIKVYTISRYDTFASHDTLEAVMAQLEPTLLAQPRQSPLPVHHNGFLIVHEAREGVWVLMNWWAGGEMLETATYFAPFDAPTTLVPSPHKGCLVCVWELEVVMHERAAWVAHVLKAPGQSSFEKYQADTLAKPRQCT